MNSSQKKVPSTSTNPQIIWTMELSVKPFKAPIITMLHDIKINTLEMNGKIDILSRETKYKKE